VVEEEVEVVQGQQAASPTTGSEQGDSDQSTQGSEPMQGLRRSGRKRKSTEKMLEVGKA
jgi:hypothetical protein